MSTAAQLLFAHVEADQSPRGVGGFHTLAVTPGLAEVDAIEARLLYQTGESAPVKRLYFTTEGGLGVVAQLVALPEPDAAGRGGRYLAHALALDAAALAAVGGDVPALLHAAPFLTTTADALAAARSGVLPPLDLAALPVVPPPPSRVPEELREEILVALAPLLAEDARRTLALLGAPEAVWAVVQSLWPTLDPALRHRCTFDTHFQGGNIARTPYALVGLTQEPTNARFDVYPLPRR